jgi:adenine-specific DNA glycosylase
VLRVSNRIGIAEGDNPEVVEQQLCSKLPKAQWTRTSDTLILHGRRICRPKPLCPECVVQDDCDYFQVLQRVERRRAPATLNMKPARKGAKRTKLKHPGRKR